MRELAKDLGILQAIIEAEPTDGLWEDDRSDEDQLGATYTELEWAMSFKGDINELTEREIGVISIYKKFNRANKHKMKKIPIYKNE